MDNMRIWGRFSTTPKEAQKTIEAGRRKGFTDINPMWRFKALTEQFGPCGIGWKLEIKDYRIEQGAGDEQRAFVLVNLYYREPDGTWSEPVPGFGGASFVSREKSGPYTNDECYKMALSDAIGTACKALGMSADIYFAKDRSKYTLPAAEPDKPKPPKEPDAPPAPPPAPLICDCCGKEIVGVTLKSGTKKTVDQIVGYSRQAFGQALCYQCTKNAINDANRKKEETPC